MVDRPILFSAPMVRALLAGTKTQTRRVLKPQPYEHKGMNCRRLMFYDRNGKQRGDASPDILSDGSCPATMFTPYANVDRLWVKETWKPGSWREDGRVACDYRASPELVHTPWCHPGNFEDLWPKWTDELVAAGSVPDADGIHHWEPGQSPLKWRPSIFMPRWVSRITLDVTDVRVERLQDISRDDAIAEGIQRVGGGMLRWENWSGAEGQSATSPQAAYAVLWNSINGEGAWEANPWVVVVSFAAHRRNIDQEQAA